LALISSAAVATLRARCEVSSAPLDKFYRQSDKLADELPTTEELLGDSPDDPLQFLDKGVEPAGHLGNFVRPPTARRMVRSPSPFGDILQTEYGLVDRLDDEGSEKDQQGGDVQPITP
jgi:hypothetical protein